MDSGTASSSSWETYSPKFARRLVFDPDALLEFQAANQHDLTRNLVGDGLGIDCRRAERIPVSSRSPR